MRPLHISQRKDCGIVKLGPCPIEQQLSVLQGQSPQLGAFPELWLDRVRASADDGLVTDAAGAGSQVALAASTLPGINLPAERNFEHKV